MIPDDATPPIDRLLLEFGQRVGLVGLAASEEGVCTLVIDEHWLLNLMANPNSQTFVLWMLLGEVPAPDRADILTRLLRANLFWRETEHATLSLMPDSETVVMVRELPLADLDAVALEAAVTRFVEAAEHCRTLLDDVPDQSTESLPPEEWFDESCLRA